MLILAKGDGMVYHWFVPVPRGGGFSLLRFSLAAGARGFLYALIVKRRDMTSLQNRL